MNSSCYKLTYSEDNTELISVEYDEHAGDNHSLHIQPGTKVIKTNAICGHEELEYIHFPDSLEIIEDNSINQCDLIKSIFIPKNVRYIGGNFMCKCNSLEEIVVDEKNKHFTTRDGILTTADFKHFIKLPAQKNIEHLKIPDHIEKIYTGALCFNKYLKSISFPKQLKILSSFICGGCSNLEKATLPSNLEIIEKYAFWACDNISEIDFPDTLQKIGYGAFSGCSFTEIYLPDSLKVIDGNAFWGCENLKSLHIPQGLEKIEDGAFAVAPLENITIDNGNEFITIKDEALFADKGKRLLLYFSQTAKDYSIPGGTEFIDQYAFNYATNLLSIEIPVSLKQIKFLTFNKCDKLKRFIVPGMNPYFHEIDNILFSKNLSMIHQYPNGKKTKNGVFYIPDGVKAAIYRRSDNNQINEVSFPKRYYSPFEAYLGDDNYKKTYREIKCSYNVDTISDEELRKKAANDELELSIVLYSDVGIEPLHSELSQDIVAFWAESYDYICYVDIKLIRDFIKDMIEYGDVLGLRYKMIPECDYKSWYLGRDKNKEIKPPIERLKNV